MASFNGNGLRLMPHEELAAKVTIWLFCLLSLWIMGAELFNSLQRPSELVYLLFGHISSEMKALTLGRGEGGTLEGKS